MCPRMLTYALLRHALLMLYCFTDALLRSRRSAAGASAAGACACLRTLTCAYACVRMLRTLLMLYYSYYYCEAGGALRALALLERVQAADVLPHVDMLRLVVVTHK